MQTPAETYFETAVQHMQRGDRHQALAFLQEALIVKPDYAVGWGTRGCILVELQCFFDALVSFDRAIAIHPGGAEYWNNRGSALANLGRQRMAIEAFNKAIELSPQYNQAWENKAVLLGEDGQNEEAIRIYRRQVEKKPDDQTAHVHLGMLLIKTGQMKEGWQHYEYRTRMLKQNSRGIPCPLWNGELLQGKTLLVYSEQGMGDAIQFMRYAPMVKQRTGAKVILEVNFPLARLTSKSLQGVDEVISLGDPITNADYAVSMMSLPMILGTNTPADIPWSGPYLSVDQHAVDNWQRKLMILPDVNKNLCVGVCWSGMARENQPDAKAVDARRSVQLWQLAELAKVKGITWVSLQKGPSVDQAKSPPAGMTIGVFTHELQDFYETAALMENLDLIISVDTSVAHIAGAMGKPVWMLSRYDGCWRWGTQDKITTLWYPTMRIFRQPTWGDWNSVMLEAAKALEELAGDR